MIKQQASPIIIVQDIDYNNSISTTTNDILNQAELLRYSPNLKGIDLGQFMQMTDEKDFKQYGIRRQKDCKRLSEIARSIRRSSVSSISSSSSLSDEFEDTDSTVDSSSDKDIPIIKELLQKFQTRRRNSNSSNEEESKQPWPNSIKRTKSLASNNVPTAPPKYAANRRFSLPSSLIPSRHVLFDKQPKKPIRSSSVPRIPTSSNSRYKENLPQYSCSVQKMGKALAKIEFTQPGVKPRRRKWKDVYMELQGTVLKIYESQESKASFGGYSYMPTMTRYMKQSPKYCHLLDLSLSEAKVDNAPDYTKKQNVFRITTREGPQILFHVQTCAAALLWTEKIASGINIAIDLERQHMPKFKCMLSFEDPQNSDYHRLSSSSSSSSIRQTYQNYINEERQRAETQQEDVLI